MTENLGEKECFQFFCLQLHAALVAEHSMLLGRPPRTTWNEISFVCAARRITRMQRNEGANVQAVRTLESTCH